MIYSLKGQLTLKTTNLAVISCGGVGFQCAISLSTYGDLPAVGDECMLYTHLDVKEDSLNLYGFSSREELNCFRLLTSVSGVGPKFAIAMLSDMSPAKVALCIAAGDVKSLTSCPGIGPKIANRMILELKDKVGDLTPEIQGDVSAVKAAPVGSNVSEALDALVALGYSQAEATVVLAKLDNSLPAEELIKQALKSALR